MSLPPIGSIGPSIGRISPLTSGGAEKAAAGGSGDFSSAITKAIDNVGGLEKQADSALSSFASGGPIGITDVMAATSKASLGMSVVNEIRNRGLEAYQQILSVQV
jgi:flagellar hook-basal body complex protein FliE